MYIYIYIHKQHNYLIIKNLFFKYRLSIVYRYLHRIFFFSSRVETFSFRGHFRLLKERIVDTIHSSFSSSSKLLYTFSWSESSSLCRSWLFPVYVYNGTLGLDRFFATFFLRHLPFPVFRRQWLECFLNLSREMEYISRFPRKTRRLLSTYPCTFGQHFSSTCTVITSIRIRLRHVFFFKLINL